MVQNHSDGELLKAYVQRGEDECFATLVQRHGGLVYGTALRKVGESGIAEEVMQNVFIALARKAPFLPRDIPLAAWLHKATLLEAQQTMRGELRRKRREEMAMREQEQLREAEPALVHSLIDETLLELSERERQALLLRYFEGKSLREVGHALGISDDTAQKRVSKALEQLSAAFRRRGHAVPSLALVLAGLHATAPAVPAALLSAVSVAAVQQGAALSLTGFAVVASHFMTLTKTQLLAACLVLGATPVVHQWTVSQAEARNGAALQSEMKILETRHSAQVADRTRAERRLKRIDEQLISLQEQVMAAKPPTTPPLAEVSTKDPYLWEEGQSFVRIPKNLLPNIKLQTAYPEDASQAQPVLARDGKISPVLLGALGLEGIESEQVVAAARDFAAEFRRLENAKAYPTNGVMPGVSFPTEDGQVHTFFSPPFPEEGAELRLALETQLTLAIGPERTRLFLQQIEDNLRDDFRQSGEFGRWRVVARAVEPKRYVYATGLAGPGNVSINSFVATVPLAQVPEDLRHLVERPDERIASTDAPSGKVPP